MTRSLVQLSVLICVLGNVATAFVHPSRRWTIQSKDTRPIFHTDTLTRRNNILRSSLDDDPEALEDEEYTFAPTNERDAYVTEAEQAQQANEMVATMQQSIDLPSEISNSFLRYALSIIMGRAIPDARDGLKPVHRRILYAMDQLNLYSSSGHRKCARVVGEVLGKFHPHGDMAVYDALVRLAQDFSTNYPLIDGHGNFGSIDADPAAAMRYTECRLTKLAQVALLEDLPESTVDFVSNFDGNEVEPNVLPAKLPILLLNGSSGIAVGMATNVPPHNLREVMTACVALVKARQGKTDEITEKQLLKFIPGPDFPTGAAILGTEGAKQLYTTSNGGVKMRAITNVEHVTKGKTTRDVIVVTELPYQVNKAALLEKMAALVNEKKLEGISDLRDESDRDGIRVVIELKRDAVASVVLNNLYQKTPLQTTFSGNFLALMHNGNQQGDDVISSANLVPQRFTLRQALDCFLDFRFATLRRKAKHKLEKVTARAHIVDGLLLALERVDDVIDIVRSAKDQNDARDKVQETLGTSEKQTDSILKLQLGQLTRLNKGKLTLEKQELESDRKRLTNLLEVDNAVYDAMTEEFEDMSKRFGVNRKTRIEVEEEGEVDELELVENSRSVIVVTRGGYVKRMPLKTFESQGRGTRGKRSTSDSSDESEIAHCFTCNDHDTLLMITQQGIAYALRAYQVPIGSRTAKGQPIPSVLPVKSDDVITSILPITEFTKNEYIVLATEKGWIKKTSLSSFKAITARGLTIATLDENDRLNWCNRCTDQDDILIGSSLGMATRFTAKDLRATGRTSRGVKAMKLKSDDTLASMNVLQGDSEDSVFVITSSGYGKRVKTDEFRLTERGRLGVIAIKFKKGNEDDRVRTLLSVHDDDELLVITAKGIIVRQKISEIPTQGRAATGVLIQKVDDGDFISSVSIVPKVDEIV